MGATSRPLCMNATSRLLCLPVRGHHPPAIHRQKKRGSIRPKNRRRVKSSFLQTQEQARSLFAAVHGRRQPASSEHLEHGSSRL